MGSEEVLALYDYLSANNGLLVRLIQDIEFLIALFIVIILSFVYYSCLKFFTRF